MKFRSLFKKKSIELILYESKMQGQTPHALRKTLKFWDLTALGVAAILGAGVFSTIGNAAYHGGPAVIFLFIFTAIACGFSAFCYAEFASALPISGSSYSYAYASFGELLAWIIGWDLLIEYAISNIAVAISWSQYFTHLLSGYGILIPKYLTMDFLSASRGFDQVQMLLSNNLDLVGISKSIQNTEALRGYYAWMEAPRVLGVPIICDLPALFITAVITWIVFVGIEESKKVSNFLVLLKVFIVLLVIAVGAFYVQPAHWVPFAPHGASGVLNGVSAVFFAYIGFDAISSTAEECKNPQKDLPRSMILSLVICTVLYVIVALVLTGMIDYQRLGVGDPLAFVFGPEGVNLPWIAGIINIGAVIALSTVLLVYQIGQPRIWMAMSRDGLLPPIFSRIHAKYKTPSFSTVLTGFVVAIPSLFMNLKEVTDLASIGTLFAFSLVCAGVMHSHPNHSFLNQSTNEHRFKVPYLNSKYVFPLTVISTGLYLFNYHPELIHSFLNNDEPFLLRIPSYSFVLLVSTLSLFSFLRNLSLIPVLGLVTCTYLMAELGITNWIRFGAWLLIGLVIYFAYGLKHSKLNRVEANETKSIASTPKTLSYAEK